MMEKVMWKGAERKAKIYLATGNNSPTQGWELGMGRAPPIKKKKPCNIVAHLPSLFGRGWGGSVRALWSSHNKPGMIC